MRKKLKKLILPFLCIGFCCAALGTVKTVTEADGISIDEVCYQEFYEEGEEIELMPANIYEGGKAYSANAAVIYPSGKKYGSSTVTLNECGNYKVEYSAKIGEKIVKEYKEFTVRTKLYNFSNASLSTDESLHLVFDSQNSKFTFERPINVAALTGSDVVTAFRVYLDSNKKVTLKKFKVILTDVYDENNTVTCLMNMDNAMNGLAYCQAAATGQQYKGLKSGIYDSELFVGEGNYGVPICGTWLSGSYLYCQYSFDYAERRIYTSPYTATKGNMVIDLDDSAFYGNPWNGFTTGEVYVSFVCENLTALNVDVEILSVKGLDFSKNDYVSDTEAPLIDINYGEYTETDYPHAVTGSTYSVFDAVAWDRSGINGKTVKPRVYYAYNSSGANEIDVVDGKFRVDYAGIYTLVYECEDAFGNKGQKLINIYAEKEKNPIKIELQEAIQDPIYAGDTVVFPKLNISNAVGNYEEKYVISKDGTEITLVPDGDGEYVFSPSVGGVYYLKINVVDYVGRKASGVYAVTVEVKDENRFLGEAVMPEYLYDGYEFTPPLLKGYNYYTQQYCDVEIYLTDKNGEKKLEDGVCIPQVDKSYDKITITYKAGAVSKSYEIPVIKVGSQYELLMQNFFVKNDAITTVLGNSNIMFIAAEDTTLKYSNKVLAEDFSVKFFVQNGYENYDTLNLLLYDSVDKSRTLKLSFVKNGDNSKMYINDSVSGHSLSYSFGADGTTPFYLSYVNSEKLIKIDGKSIYITQYADGRAFEGFTSQFIKMEFELLNVHGNAALTLQSISRQVFTSDAEEYIKPSVYIDGSTGGYYKLNDVYTLAKLYCGDVLSLETSVSYTFTAPDGSVVISEEGVALENMDGSTEYTVKLTQYGKYSFSLKVKDQNGNTFSKNYFVTVKDTTGPQIVVNGQVPEKVAIGSEVSLPEFTLADDTDDAPSGYIWIKRPDGIMAEVKDYKFVADIKGRYMVCYYAFDKDGNPSWICCYIEAE